MQETFFTSDLHLGHENIIKYCDRPYKDVNEMNEAIIDNFNRIVSPGDNVYILGDFSFKADKEKARKWLGRLHGAKHLIVGNHDINWERVGGFSAIHQIFEKKFGKTRVIMCHYPLAEWPGDDRGVIMLHGHSHNKKDYNKRQKELGILRFDVGVDANNYRPVSLDEIEMFFQGIEGKRCWEQTWCDCDFRQWHNNYQGEIE